ncbi:hypothetical protein SAMN04488689_105386 [Paenibacillus sp. cl6col]|nr:hypothetical protein SAMN04488689_105386 [Paenibacillus sp. cl6col]
MFQDIYFVFGLLFLISFSLIQYTNLFSQSIKLGIILVVVLVMLGVIKEILLFERGSEEYFYRMLGWWFAVTFFTMLISIHLIQLIPNSINLFIIPFFYTMYYGMRYLFVRWIRHWFFYFLLFLMMPIISLFVYSFIGRFLFEITNERIFISDSVSKWMVILFCILLINFFIYWTPSNRFDEVKVAVYLLLAVFSTISYCFFISDYLAELVTPRLNQIYKLNIITTFEIKELIDSIVKWISLPYLIGSVFACFTIEIVNRNKNMRGNSR